MAVGIGAAAAGAYDAYGAYADPRGPYYSYGYYGWEDYAPPNGIVCRPGTWFRGQDGLQHLCQQDKRRQLTEPPCDRSLSGGYRVLGYRHAC